MEKSRNRRWMDYSRVSKEYLDGVENIRDLEDDSNGWVRGGVEDILKISLLFASVIGHVFGRNNIGIMSGEHILKSLDETFPVPSEAEGI
uniref:Uncharacterized protein n=1 Tax=Solanum lycopersicum TaxID=4081 RepID=A0A3Q7IXA2_SOLLC